LFVDPGHHRLEARQGEEHTFAEVEATAGVASRVQLAFTRTPAAAPKPLVVPARPEPAKSTGRAGWLTVTGTVAAGLGGVGIVGFGLRTQSLQDQYVRDPSSATRDDGLRMRALTNASIAVAGAGALLVALDLLVFRSGERPSEVSAARPFVFTF
jgi:hypothetical protein